MVLLPSIAAFLFVAVNALARYRATSKPATDTDAALVLVTSTPPPECPVPSVDPVTDPSVSVELTSWTFPLASQLLLANAFFWILLWILCACCHGRCERLQRKRSFFREMTGAKIIRSKSIRHWIVPTAWMDTETIAERGFPVSLGEKTTKVSRYAQPSRLVPVLSGLGKTFTAFWGLLFVFVVAFVSVVLALSQIRRRRVYETHETIYEMAWASIIEAIEATPGKVLQFYVSRMLYDNLLQFISWGVGALITGFASICYCVRKSSKSEERMKKLEETVRASLPPAETRPPSVQDDIFALGRIESDPKECKDGGHPSPVKRSQSVAKLEANAVLRRGNSVGVLFGKSKVRDADLHDIAEVPNLGALPWLGARPVSAQEASAPPPDYDEA